MWLCAAQTEQRTLADRKLIHFLACLTETIETLCGSDDSVDSSLVLSCVHVDTVDAQKLVLADIVRL